MAKCAYCGSNIIFRGVKDGDKLYCNEECRQNGYLLTVLDQVPAKLLNDQIESVHQGICPKCGKPGPVDVHTSHRVWSILVMTSWSSRPQICCRSCGIKSKLADSAFSFFLGWWGFPWGIIFTPVQIIRNLVGIFSSPDPSVPSENLQRLVGLDLAEKVVAAQAAAPTAPAVPPPPPPVPAS